MISQHACAINKQLKYCPKPIQILPKSIKFHKKSSLKAFLNHLRVQKLRLVEHCLIWGLSFDPQRKPKVPQNATEAHQDDPQRLLNWKNIAFRSAFFNDAVFLAMLLTIFNDFTALLTRKNLIFAGRRSVLSIFPKKQISHENSNFDAFWQLKMLPKSSPGHRKIKKV